MTEEEALDELAACRAEADQLKALICHDAANDPIASISELFKALDKLEEIAAALEDARALLR